MLLGRENISKQIHWLMVTTTTTKTHESKYNKHKGRTTKARVINEYFPDFPDQQVLRPLKGEATMFFGQRTTGNKLIRDVCLLGKTCKFTQSEKGEGRWWT